MRTHPLTRIAVTALMTAGLALAPAAPGLAASASTARTFANCTAMHKVYSGGIAKAGVRVNRTPSGSRPLKGHVLHSTAAYKRNAKSDRDHDGVACEKS